MERLHRLPSTLFKDPAAKWHIDIMKITREGQKQIDGWVLEELQRATNSFLNKQRRLSSGGQGDTCLLSLIRQHPDKTVAITACAHALSREAVRDVIRDELLINLGHSIEEQHYLKTVVTIGRVHIDAMKKIEIRHAELLLSLSSPEVFVMGNQLLELENILNTADLCSELLSCKILSQIPGHACLKLGQELQIMKEEGRWGNAVSACSWLWDLSEIDHPLLVRMLTRHFPDWRYWSVWSPNVGRLELWRHLSVEQREGLKDILMLESPSEAARDPTLAAELRPMFDGMDGWSVRHNRFFARSATREEIYPLLVRLLGILDVVILRCMRALPLFTAICLDNVVDLNVLAVLEYVTDTSDLSNAAAIRTILTPAWRNIQVGDLTKFLDNLNRNSNVALRSMLSYRLKHIVEENMARLQNMLREHIQYRQGPIGVARTLHSLGQALRDALWLQPVLHSRLRIMLQDWPTSEELYKLLEIRARAQSSQLRATTSLTENIDIDLAAWLIGHGPVNRSESPVQGLIHVWRQPNDSSVRDLALAIASLSNIPDEVRCRCLKQLCAMNERFIARFDAIVRQENDAVCVNFVDILSTGHLTEGGGVECWKELLWHMIDQRKNTIVDSVLSHFESLEEWFQWLTKVGMIFDSSGHDQARTPILLRRSLHAWNRRLSTRYMQSLGRLGSGSEPSPQDLRWVLVDCWEQSVELIPLLDFLDSPGPTRCYGAMRPVRALLKPDGSNALRVSIVLGLLSRTSAKGAEACVNIVDTQEISIRSVAEETLVKWLTDNNNLTAIDMQALRSTAEILGMTVPGNDPQSETQTSAVPVTAAETPMRSAEAMFSAEQPTNQPRPRRAKRFAYRREDRIEEAPSSKASISYNSSPQSHETRPAPVSLHEQPGELAMQRALGDFENTQVSQKSPSREQQKREESLPTELHEDCIAELQATVPSTVDHLYHGYMNIMAEARRLENLRVALQRQNRSTISGILNSAGIQCPTILVERATNIPSSLLDVVEHLDSGGHELCFPLTRFKSSQRAQLGMGEARAVLLRIRGDSESSFQMFCIHLLPEQNHRPPLPTQGSIVASSDGHSYWEATRSSRIPDVQFCCGMPNRTVYQLNRVVWGILRSGSAMNLVQLYDMVSSSIDCMADVCVVCGTPLDDQRPRLASQGTQLETCQPSCAVKYARSDVGRVFST